MSRRDFQCALSGVSLLDAETALFVLQCVDGEWLPAGLPLWGRYDGLGTLADIQEGPNADLLLGRFQQDLESGNLSVDWDKMGLEEQAIDHVETLMSVIACSQLAELGAVRTKEGPLGFALLSAHVAAAIMNGEPELAGDISVEGLPQALLRSPWGQSVYAPIAELPIKLRCKFGLSFAGLACLIDEMKAQEIPWQPPGLGIAEEEAEPALWMAQALVKFAQSAPLVEALEDYAGQEEDEPEG
jgi:hypothetical protein